MLPGVSKTALLTMRARVDEHARPDRVLTDPLAAEWWTRVEWPPELDAWYASQQGLAYRAHDIDEILTRYARLEPPSAVVELGAGLSTRRSRLPELGAARWIDLDLPPVASLRAAWGAGGEQLGASVLDTAWMAQLAGERCAFVIEGLLYYLPRAEVLRLFRELAARFPGSIVIMDVLGRLDHPKLLEVTTALGTPIAWGHEGPYDAALSDLGLSVVEGFEPGRLSEDAIARYWHRFDAKTRGGIYFAKHSEALWARRSGVVLGRL